MEKKRTPYGGSCLFILSLSAFIFFLLLSITSASAQGSRNVWDPPTPPNNTDLTKDGLVVELCIYVFEHSAKDEAQVRADVAGASAIWCQSKINIQAVHFERHPPLPPSEPLDLNSTDLAGQVLCNPLPDAVRDQFFNIDRRGCPDITKSVAVFYIPGRRLQDGFAKGCSQFRRQGGDARPEHFILLTDEADGRVLAHELGHALFTREISYNTWINYDPDPKADASRIHNSDPQNLMFPNVAMNPVISPEQSSQAKKSDLTLSKKLAIGYRENKNFKLGVKLRTLTVHSSSDEFGSDDLLESYWHFTVRTKKADVKGTELYSLTKNWDMDPLHWQDYELNLDYPLPELSSDNDKLVIEVRGSDVDSFSGDDELAPIDDEWCKGQDTWGSNCTDTDILNGLPGDHRTRVSNSEIDYSLTYNIRVDDQPKEVIFRDICDELTGQDVKGTGCRRRCL